MVVVVAASHEVGKGVVLSVSEARRVVFYFNFYLDGGINESKIPNNTPGPFSHSLSIGPRI